MMHEMFIGRGVADIPEGYDTVAARQRALADAQQKAVLAAVSAAMAVDRMAAYFLTVRNLVLARAQQYVHRFKIISEYEKLGCYYVTIQAAVHQQQLRKALVDMEILEPEPRRQSVLLMISREYSGRESPRCWWSAAPEPQGAEVTSPDAELSVTEPLGDLFVQRGLEVVPLPEQEPGYAATQCPQSCAPDDSEVRRCAAYFGADLVVSGTAVLSAAQMHGSSSTHAVQCDLEARIIDVRSGAVHVQGATHALGVSVHTGAAAQDAVRKASLRIADQLIDKLQLQRTTVRQYAVTAVYGAPVPGQEVRSCMNSIIGSFPDADIHRIESAGDNQTWQVSLSCQANRASVLEKIFEKGVAGYSLEVQPLDKDSFKIIFSAGEAKEP